MPRLIAVEALLMTFRFLLLLFLVTLPTLATTAGPLDGPWQAEHGRSIFITSEVVHASIYLRSADGRVRLVRARYTGYTRLTFPVETGGWGEIEMVERDRIRVTGGAWSGLYSR